MGRLDKLIYDMTDAMYRLHKAKRVIPVNDVSKPVHLVWTRRMHPSGEVWLRGRRMRIVEVNNRKPF